MKAIQAVNFPIPKVENNERKEVQA
jgi:hypothetical protein